MHRYILSLASSQRPSICLIATGKGDDPECIERFYEAFRRESCEPTHLGLFNREVRDLRSFVLGHEIILAWGGNTASMLAVWRAHGLDKILREAADQGTILAGACAGALAWFESGVTDSFGGLDAYRDGLGLLAGSHCPYYDADPERRPTYQRLIASGDMDPGVAADVNVALLYEDGELAEVVASREDAFGWRVTTKDGVREEKLTPRLL
jgi:peptidase E